MKKILFFLGFLLIPALSLADTSFSFSTDPQSIPMGVMSGKINIQASSPVSETTYLIPSSNSGTGQFLTSTGNMVGTIYISTGDSNRAIYYKDSTAGDFVITVVVQNKTKTATLATISQHIFVGVASTTNANTDTTTTQGDSAGNIAGISAHGSSAPLSSTPPATEFEVSAGRDRVTMPGSSVLFKVSTVKLQNILQASLGFKWSFGDGTTGFGKEVSHVYPFPGDYEAVVNAQSMDNIAVSKVVVHVVAPNISVTRVSGGAQVTNKSGTEINLENWKLVGSGHTFIFPADTLILPGKKVIFADDVTLIYGDVSIADPLGKVLVYAASTTPASNLVVVTNPVKNNTELPKSVVSKPKPLIQTASVIQATGTPASRGLWNFIRHFFVEQ